MNPVPPAVADYLIEQLTDATYDAAKLELASYFARFPDATVAQVKQAFGLTNSGRAIDPPVSWPDLTST